jgi:hypothetical protein
VKVIPIEDDCSQHELFRDVHRRCFDRSPNRFETTWLGRRMIKDVSPTVSDMPEKFETYESEVTRRTVTHSDMTLLSHCFERILKNDEQLLSRESSTVTKGASSSTTYLTVVRLARLAAQELEYVGRLPNVNRPACRWGALAIPWRRATRYQ